MSQALYRKYRSRSFDEIIGQGSVVTALQNALKNNAVSHAYLFTGPRGVGKTSIARIFAYAINNVPYVSDELPVDIIEIDAASNRGIDEVRDLREKVRIAPVVGPYKIYIIDEVHMLTSHAFNALLKTLEEPPAHVVFILATTESHKLPETITSRTQRYNFTLATTEETVAHLSVICEKESLKADADALTIIAKSSGGSLRDALSLLDHARHIGTNINADDVRQHIGMPSDEVVDGIIAALSANDPARVLQELNASETGAITAIALAKQLIDALTHDIQHNKNSLPLPVTTKLLHGLIGVETSTQQDVALRIALLSAIDGGAPAPRPVVKSVAVAAKPVKHTEPVKAPPATAVAEDKPVVAPVLPSEPAKEVKVANEAPKPASSPVERPEGIQQLTYDAWLKVLEDIRSTHNTIYSVLRMAEADFAEAANSKLTLNFKFPFHQKRMNDMKNKDIICNRLQSMGYGNFEIVCGVLEKAVLQPAEIAPQAAPPDDNDAVLSQIRGVFGSAEVLE